jgi:hypothetical protein
MNDKINVAYGLLMSAFEVLEDADLFDDICANVSVFHDEYCEEIEERGYAERILELCHGK